MAEQSACALSLNLVSSDERGICWMLVDQCSVDPVPGKVGHAHRRHTQHLCHQRTQRCLRPSVVCVRGLLPGGDDTMSKYTAEGPLGGCQARRRSAMARARTGRLATCAATWRNVDSWS
eukprot:TRINITY_DN2801_c1_g1_i1.p1 TRINITY_DN2801_c1_g1~~TRINITY_DN2801_c1_g1_i1.p1  ORF type:complete len:139 (+),score=4.60 TRINITY_DN2801_c1_g1_i1:62-418(+)